MTGTDDLTRRLATLWTRVRELPAEEQATLTAITAAVATMMSSRLRGQQ